MGLIYLLHVHVNLAYKYTVCNFYINVVSIVIVITTEKLRESAYGVWHWKIIFLHLMLSVDCRRVIV